MKKACTLLLVLLLASCSSIGKLLPSSSSDPDNAQVVLGTSKDGTTSASLKFPGLGNLPSEATSSPDGASSGAGAAPGGSMFDFSSAFENPGQNRRAHWWHSGTEAIEHAKRTGLPMLIFFTHQSIDPARDMAVALSNTPELTGDNPRFIPLYLDYSDKTTTDSSYYHSFMDRYKPRGYPVLIVTLPDGTELNRQTGCNKDWRSNVNHWLDDAASRVHNGMEAHRKKLQPHQFRFWKSKDGQEVFARLDSQDANQLVFTNEWGESIHTFIGRLSDEDQQRIAAKKS